ncbi:hypothetical protein IX332_001604 [Porphyromonas levii]|uniref:hypothetical protein n=1 Tax=Porphyromonas levii TaxID=28114 RepID=UPI001B8B88E3|nr:hypothetical protein [Porphyromonas levii]MBR8702964.1 hypothetical protein [Porphyromonas levii]MBR8730264.1 hypothetical protein [Porphyromonas levii]MBR8773721.1 hypothetical protein [Porphyromonas levii]
MNDEFRTLLDLLEEVKQQNKEIKTSVANLEGRPNGTSTEVFEQELQALTKTLQLVLDDHIKWKKELTKVAIVLGKRIAEIKNGFANSTKASNEVVAKLEETQSTQTPSITKKYFLLDAKRWIQWAIWGILVLLVTGFFSWNIHLHKTNQSLKDYALRYRILRMEHSVSNDSFALLDSIFVTHRSEVQINQLKERVINYEMAIQRQAELLYRQQQLSAEQEKVQQQLNQ